MAISYKTRNKLKADIVELILLKKTNYYPSLAVQEELLVCLKDVDEVQPTSTWKEEFTFERVIPNLTKLTTNSIHDLDDRGGHHDVSSHALARHGTTVLISTLESSARYT
jgi:hypothetical protein